MHRDERFARAIPLAVVAGLAFVLRVIWLTRPGSDWTLNSDSILYVSLARGIAHGCGFAPYNGTCGAPEVLRTPGYPVFLMFFLSNFRWAIVAQALIGALMSILVGRFASRHYGRLAGIVAATFVAIDVPTILISKELMTEPLFQAVATVAIFSSLEGAGILSGATAGIATLVRPVGVVLVPVVVLADFIRGGWRAAAPALGIALVIIGGWAARNYRDTGNLTLSVEGGYNLYQRTAPAIIARHDRITLAAADASLDRELDSAIAAQHLDAGAATQSESGPWRAYETPSVSSFMFWRALSIIFQHPIDAAAVTVHGFVQLAFEPYLLETGWHGFVQSPLIFRLIRFASTTIQGLVLAILWIGVILALWREPRDIERWILFSSAILLLLAASPFGISVNARFRAPAIPFLAVLAGAAWAPRNGSFRADDDRVSTD